MWSGGSGDNICWVLLVSGWFSSSKTIIPEAGSTFSPLQPESTQVISVDSGLAEAPGDLKSIVVQTNQTFSSPATTLCSNTTNTWSRSETVAQPDWGKPGFRFSCLCRQSTFWCCIDKDVYDYVRKQLPTETDVDVLNGLQVISANNNLYFNDWKQSTAIEDLASRYAHLRQHDPTVLNEFSSDENPQHFLTVSYDQTPNIGLDMSFLQVKRRASRLSLSK